MATQGMEKEHLMTTWSRVMDKGNKQKIHLNNIKHALELELVVLSKLYLHIVLKLCDFVIINTFYYLRTIDNQLRLRYYCS